MNRVDYTSCPDVSGLTCLWVAHVTCFSHHWWFSLMSLDLSHWYIYNGINGVIIEVLVCLQGIFLSFLFFSLSLYSLLVKYCVFWILQFEKVFRWYLWLSNHIYYTQLSKLYYFSKYFLHYIVLSFFFSMLVSKNSLLRQPIEIPSNWKVKKG